MHNEIIIGTIISIVIVFMWKRKSEKVDSLHTLVKRGNLNALKKRINSLNINEVDKDGYTALHIAIYYCEFECIKFLFQQGASIDIPNKEGDMPLHSAEDNFQVIQFLLENGANIHQENNYGATVLMGAVSTPNNLKVVRLLVDSGAKINIKNKYGNTPLHEASLNSGTIENIKLLLSNSIDINVLNNDLETPLDIAYKHENLELVKYLTSHGATYNNIS